MTRLAYLRQLRHQGKRNLDFLMDAQGEERIRQVLWRELRTHSGQRALALHIGVGRSVIRKFVEMRSVPTADNMKKIREWVEDRPDAPVPLGSLCLAALVAELDADRRYSTRRELARVLVRLYVSEDREVPEWLRDEIARTLKDARLTHLLA